MKITRTDKPTEVPLKDVAVGTVFSGRLHGSHVKGDGPFMRCQSGAVCLATGQHSKLEYETEVRDAGVFLNEWSKVGWGIDWAKGFKPSGYTIPVKVEGFQALDAEMTYKPQAAK